MFRLDRAVVVEGKYDKIKLSNIIDANIITTDGFGIFKDSGKREYIKRLAKEKGIVIITDSDSAGAVIRSHIKSFCSEGDIINIHIPQLSGKEKRKQKPSKEGLLGVEGIDEDILKNALNRALKNQKAEKKEQITKTDLYCFGLSGGQNSSALRRSLAFFLNIPLNLSPNAFLDAINSLFTRETFLREVEKWQQDTDKN